MEVDYEVESLRTEGGAEVGDFFEERKNVGGGMKAFSVKYDEALQDWVVFEEVGVLLIDEPIDLCVGQGAVQGV